MSIQKINLQIKNIKNILQIIRAKLNNKIIYYVSNMVIQ